MPYWIRGRDRHTGRAIEPFASAAPSEMAARVDAIARGIIVESITAAQAEPGERIGPSPPLPPIARAGAQTPHAARYHDDDPYRNYEVMVGPRSTMYYLRLFVDFDRAGRARITWHWPAFFVGFFWLLYRKMWAYSMSYLIAVVVVGVAAGILAELVARIMGLPAGSQSFNRVVDSTMTVYAALVLVVPAMYANALYHRHCRREVERARSSGSTERQRLEWLTKKGGTQLAAVIAPAIIIAIFVGFMVAISRYG